MRARARLLVVTTVVSLTACGPSAPTDDAGGPDVGLDATTAELRDTGTDATEHPDAASAELVLSPARLDFELAAPGCVRSGELTLSNEGNSPSGPLSFAIVGLDASQFAVASYDCPEALEAGARCDITVELRPMYPGSFEASLVVQASDHVATAELRGQAASDCDSPPRITPIVSDFGDVTLGETGAPQTFSVINPGRAATGTLTLSTSGVHAGSFAVTRDACSGTSLPGGLSCDFEVVMSPTMVGELVASLDVAHSDWFMTSARLSGRGVEAGSIAVFEPTAADFGSWSAGEESPPVTFTIRNPGTTATGVVSITLEGRDTFNFAIDSSTSTCDRVSLAGGASCVVHVSFVPTSGAGPQSASLRFSATPGGTVLAALSGTGL